MKLQELYERVSELNMADVISTRIDLVQHGPNWDGLCPFHNDKSIGSFKVTPSKNLFKCFACDVGGDAIQFISKFDEISRKEAIIKIAVEFGIISKREAERLSNITNFSKPYPVPERLVENEIKPFKLNSDKINQVYHYFSLGDKLADGDVLSQEHREYLHSRGILDDDIEKNRYFSMPSPKSLHSFLNNSGLPFIGTPGFFINENKEISFLNQKGIGIPIRNYRGQIIGIQVRRDVEVPGKSRYYWFSSAFAHGTKNEVKGGTSSGSPLDVVFPDEINYIDEISNYKCSASLFFTEGHFKADSIAKKYKSVAVSVQGVGNWKNDILNTIDGIQKRYRNSIKHIYVAFDADLVYNVQVFKQALKMTLFLQKYYKDKYTYKFVLWDIDRGKGIDDVINSGNNQYIDLMESTKFFNAYSDFLKNMILDENQEAYLKIKDEDIMSIMETHSKLINDVLKNIPEEKMKEYFFKFVLSKLKKYSF